jgi:hypothetical protein
MKDRFSNIFAHAFGALGSTSGTIEGECSENSIASRGLGLGHTIRVELATDRPRGKTEEAVLTLNTFDLPMKCWDDLQNREYRFSDELNQGFADGEPITIGPHVDGTIRLSGTTYPVKATLIAFAKIVEGTIPARISLLVAPSTEAAPPSGGTAKLDLTADLKIGGIRVRGDLAKFRPPSLDEAKAIAAKILDLSQFEDPAGEPFLTFYAKRVKVPIEAAPSR